MTWKDAALVVLAGAVLLLLLRPRPEPVVRYERVEVPVERIVEREPDTVVRIVERVRYLTPEPVQVAVAPGGAQLEVARFCAPAVLDAVSDTAARPAPQLLLRSVTHDPGWFFQRDRILLTGPTSYGDLVAADYEVRPGWTARAVGDSVIVRSPRFGVARDVVELGVAVLVGYGVRALVGG